MAAPLTSAPVFADLASHAEASKATHLRALLDDVERSGALMAEHGGKYLAPRPTVCCARARLDLTRAPARRRSPAGLTLDYSRQKVTAETMGTPPPTLGLSPL